MRNYSVSILNCSRLFGIASRRAEKAAEWAKEFEIPNTYASYEEMLADPRIDAVINTLPMTLHCDWVVKACETGKHTLCEKPMALSVEEAERIIAAAKANDVIVMEGFTHRFQPQLAHARELVRQGAIGNIRIVRAEVIYATQDWENDSRANAALGGCVTVEAGCYCADTIRYFMQDEPFDVKGFAVQRNEDGLDTTFSGIMKFPGNRLGVMNTCMETSFRACCEVIGTEGRIEMHDLFFGSGIWLITGTGSQNRKPEPQGDHLQPNRPLPDANRAFRRLHSQWNPASHVTQRLAQKHRTSHPPARQQPQLRLNRKPA